MSNHTVIFFGKKNMLILIGVVMGLYLVLNAGSIGYGMFQQAKKNRQIAAQAEAYNNLPPAEKAIIRAEAYQVNVITASQTHQRLFYDYVQRTYGLDQALGVAKTPLNIPKEGERGYSEESYYMARIAFPDIAPKDPPKGNPEDISLTNIYSANCDNIPLPSNFWQTMREQRGRGGYYLTHVALAFSFLEFNHCDIPDDAKVLESQVHRGMVAIAADTATGADLRYEAIAFLLLSGNRSDVRQAWIDQIAEEQLPSGAWAAEAGSKIANDHSTLLALWALLQYSRSEVEYQPLIRRPANQ